MKKWLIQKRTHKNLLKQLLINRGLTTKKDQKKFLNPQYSDLADPFLLKDIKKAIKRIKTAKHITIFGDYDADGVCASAILKIAFSEVLPKTKLDVYLPDRNSEGYGLNKKAVKYIAQKGSDLIVTVDCGISDMQEVKLANQLDLDIIITDHHSVPDKLPPAYAIINPRQKDCSFPFENLAGCGVAWELARALWPSQQVKWLLDLVAIGTIADCMPLLGENRILVKYGLKVLKKTRRKGLQALMPKTISSETIAWQLAPRLNSAGRLDHANTSYKLLLTTSGEQAKEIAQKLEKKNQKRQYITEKIIKQVEPNLDLSEKLIFAYNPQWETGVLGLAAGRLCHNYFKPTVLIGDKVGSCRSIEKFNIVKALQKCQNLLTAYGGHPQAAGFTIKPGCEQKLQKKLLKIANQQLKDKDLIESIEIAMELKPDELNWDTYNIVQKMAPFGQSNPKPKFLIKQACLSEVRCVGNGGHHLKFKADTGQNILSCIGFNFGGYGVHIKNNDKMDLVFELDKNQWNGYKNLDLKIIDLRKCNKSL